MALKRVVTQDQNLNQIQDNVDEALSAVNLSPFQSGVLLTGKPLSSSTPNQIAHTLGRMPRVWVLTDQQQNSTVWRVSWDAKFITLSCSVNCTVSMWVA
jgi:hypothetical protein